MSDRDDRLGALALSLADGTPVDWAAAESSAASESERRQIRDLRLVGQLAFDDDTPAPPGAPPDDWGPLRIIGPLGRGRFGDVYRAWDRRLDREVALKLLRRRESDDPGVGPGVIEEGRLLAKVRHPNVVTVYGAERIDGRVGVWMELIGGGTLEEALTKGPLPPAESSAIGADVARALAAVHAAGLVHRDVKAQNVMRDEHGRVVLMDFGTGQDLTPVPQSELAGTPLYLAPEVLDGAVATPRSDIYSVGVLVFHLLTGTFPITGRTVGEVRAAHLARDVLHVRAQLRDQPPALAAVIDRALAASPECRFGTAAELAAAFDSFARGAGSTSGKGAGWTTGWLVWAAGGAISAAVVGGAVWGLPFSREGRPAGVATDSPRVICDDCGMLADPSISADGSRMAFADATTFDLAVRDLASNVVTPLGVANPSATAPLMFPVLSPDARQVAFARPANDGIELLIASVLERGKTRRLVADADSGAIPLGWSADGRSVLADALRSDGSADLVWVSAASGAVTVISRLDHPQEQITASVSPDGRWIAYASVPRDRPGRPASTSRPVVVIPSTGGAGRRVSTMDGLESHPIWSSDSTHLLFKADVSGAFDLWSLAMADGALAGAPVLVRRDIGASVPIGMTAAGQLFLYERQEGIQESTIASLAGSSANGVAPSPRLLGSNPTWSPDGKAIALVRRSRAGGSARTIAVRGVETGEERVYRHDGLGDEPPLWFGDSRGLLVRVIEAGQEFWYRVELEDGRFLKLMENRGNRSFLTHKNVRALATDGTLFFGVYASQVPASPLNRIVAADLTKGTYREVLTLPGTRSTWPTSAAHLALAASPNGRTLAIQTVDPNTGMSRIWTVGVDGQGLRPLCDPFPAPDSVAERLHWTGDGRLLVFTAADAHRNPKAGPSFRVMRLPSSGGTPEFTGLETASWMYNFDVNPDGSRLVFSDVPTTGARNGVWAIDLPAPWRVR